MAEVYDGWDQRLARTVAVKVLRPELASVPQTRRRFESEARLAATLNHPNVVAVHDSGDDHGAPYIVMERLPGRTLLDELLAGPLPAPRARTVLTQTLDAVGAAHAAGILHRDIKPGNILFDANGAVKVTDFGIAKRADTDHTTAGEVLGTVNYLSPDRITGHPAVATDDLHAVGVVGYEALAGHRPYIGATILSLAHAIVNGQYRPLPAVRPDLDPALIAVIERALSSDTERRFASAAQMRNALENPRRIQPPATRVIGPVPAAADPRPAPAQPRRSPGAGVIVAAVTAMLVAIAAAALAMASQDEDSTAGSPSVLPTPASTPSPSLAPVAPPPTMTIRPEPVAPAPETVVPDYTTGGDQPIAGAGNGGGNGNQGNGNANGNVGHGNGNGGRGNGRGGN